MTSSLPNVPLLPRGARGGSSAAALRSSTIGSTSGTASFTTADSSCCRKPSGRESGIGRLGSLLANVETRFVQDTEPFHAGENPPLSVVEARLDVGREHEPTARRSYAERDRDSVLVLVADRDRDALHPELLGARSRPPVEPDRRLARRQPLDLDLLPADS